MMNPMERPGELEATFTEGPVRDADDQAAPLVDSLLLVEEAAARRRRGEWDVAAALLLEAALWALREQAPRELALSYIEQGLQLDSSPALVATAVVLLDQCGLPQRAVESVGALVVPRSWAQPANGGDRDPDGARLAAATALLAAAELIVDDASDSGVDETAAKADQLASAAVDLLPGSAAAAAARVLAVQSGNTPAAEADALERLARCCSGGDAAQIWFAAGRALELSRAEAGRVAAAYRRALEHDGQHWPARLALCSRLERAGRFEELHRELDQLASSVGHLEASAQLHYRAGILALDRLDDPQLALASLQVAAEGLSHDPAPLERLAEIYRSQQTDGSRVELRTVLERLLELTWDKRSRAALAAELAELWCEAGDLMRAAQLCDEVLETLTGYLPALLCLGRVARQSTADALLLSAYEQEVEGVGSSETRALRALDLARTLDRRNRSKRALAAYGRVIELDRRTLPAHWAIHRLLRALHADVWERARALERHAAVVSDSRTRADLLRELAELERGDPELARDAERHAEQAEALGPGWSAQLRPGSSSPAIEVELLLERAAATADPDEAHWCRVEAAAQLLHDLDEPERALEVVRPLAEDPSIAVRRTLARCYQRCGDWDRLLMLHRGELEQVDGPRDEAQLWCRMARIARDRLEDPRQAIELYQRALERDPRYLMALSELEPLLVRERSWEELVSLLSSRAEHGEVDPLRRASALGRAAEIADARLDDASRAAELYLQAIDSCRDASLAASGLARIEQRWGDWQAAEQRLARTTGDGGAGVDGEQAHVLVERAWLREQHIDREPQLELLRDAAAAASDDRYLSSELIRTCRETQSSRLASALERQAASCRDPGLSVAYLLEAARRGAAQALTEAARTAVRGGAAAAPLWGALELRLVRCERWELLAALREQAARLSPGAARRDQLSCGAARAHLRAGRFEHALAVLCRCVRDSPDHLPALAELVRITGERGLHAEQASFLDTTADACLVDQHRERLARRAAGLWRQLGEQRAELQSLLRVVAIAPDDSAAVARAIELCCQRGDGDQLLELFARRIAREQDPGGEAALRRELAVLLDREIGALDVAADQLEQALQLVPGETETLLALVDVRASQQRWRDCAVLLATVADKDDQPEQRRAARLRQAEILAYELQEPARALELVENRLREPGTDAPTWKLAIELLLELKEVERARSLCESAIRRGVDGLEFWARVALGRICEEHFGDARRRYELGAETVERALGHSARQEALIACCREQRALPWLLALGQSLLERELSAEQRRALELLMATVASRELQRPELAAKLLGAARGDG